MFFRLLLLFTLIPIIEVTLLFKLSDWLGWPGTLLLVLGTGIVGAWLAKLQGFLALNSLRGELVQGRLPADKIVDGVLILVAGIVLITPGILTDLAGLALLLPPVRKVVRLAATKWLTARVQVAKASFWQGASGAMPEQVQRPPQGEVPKGEIIDARVVETRVEE